MKLKDFLALGSPESWIVVIYDPEEEKLPFNGYLENFHDAGDYIVDSWEVAETLNEDNGDDCSELWIYVKKPKMFEHEGYMVSEAWDV